MLRIIKATVDQDGNVQLNDPIKLRGGTRALVTILDELAVDDVTLLSELALSDWNRPEDDEAWAHLQTDQS